MFNICLLLLVTISLSKNYYFTQNDLTQNDITNNENDTNDYPPNTYFNLKIKDNTKIYFGRNLAYITFNKPFLFDLDETFIDNFNYSLIIFKSNKESNSTNIGSCNITDLSNDSIEYNICFLGNDTFLSFGEIIFIKYEIISYIIVLLGFFIILYGVDYHLLGMIVHFTIFIYFFIKDLVELFGNFPSQIYPIFLLIFALISGIMISIFLGISNNVSKKDKIKKIIYGCILGFFLFKTMFYYIIFFSPLNTEIYEIFLFIFTLLGAGTGFSMIIFDTLNKYFFISCSSIPGSFYIVKGIGYIIGGYYSDIITSKKSLKFTDGKGKIVMYLILQILLIIGSFVFQINYINFKINYIENTIYNENSKNSSSNATLLNANSSKISNKNADISQDNSNSNSISNSGSGIDVNNKGNNDTTINKSNESQNDNSYKIYDQEE